MTAKKTEKAGNFTNICPNPNSPFSLWALIKKLELERGFAVDFVDLLKMANNNDKAAIACLNGYLEPSTGELDDLGISASELEQHEEMHRVGIAGCSIAKKAAGQAPP